MQFARQVCLPLYACLAYILTVLKDINLRIEDTPDQDQTHLQQQLNLSLDHVLVTVGEQFRAVT